VGVARDGEEVRVLAHDPFEVGTIGADLAGRFLGPEGVYFRLRVRQYGASEPKRTGMKKKTTTYEIYYAADEENIHAVITLPQFSDAQAVADKMMADGEAYGFELLVRKIS
jgi:hypothetical protein